MNIIFNIFFHSIQVSSNGIAVHDHVKSKSYEGFFHRGNLNDVRDSQNRDSDTELKDLSSFSQPLDDEALFKACGRTAHK